MTSGRCFIHGISIDGEPCILELDVNVPDDYDEAETEAFTEGFAQGIATYLTRMEKV